MVLKLFASRAIDIRDAEGIAVRHDKTLDWCYIEEQLIPLAEAKEEPQMLEQLARVRRLGAVAQVVPPATGRPNGLPYLGCFGSRCIQRNAVTEFFQKNFSAAGRPFARK